MEYFGGPEYTENYSIIEHWEVFTVKVWNEEVLDWITTSHFDTLDWAINYVHEREWDKYD